MIQLLLLFSFLFTIFSRPESKGQVLGQFVYRNYEKEFEMNVGLMNTIPGVRFSPLEKGKPIIAQIGNDKKIQLVLSGGEKVSLNYSLEFNENQCVPDAPVTVCQYSIEFMPLFISWIWIDHPNKEKINQFIKVQNGEIYSVPPFVSSLSPHSIKNEFSKDFSSPLIQCPHLDFFPKPLGEKIKFLSLDADSMEKNIFTGSSVNQGVLSYFGVEAKIKNSNLSLVKIEKSVKANPTQNFLAAHTPLLPSLFTSLTLKDQNNEACQISISVEAKDIFINFIDILKSKKVIRPLSWNEKILQMGLESNLTNFYRYSTQYENGQIDYRLEEMD